MGLDFDLKSFIEDMRACKPPYRCPFEDCGRVYKSFPGIHTHLNAHASGTAGSGSRTPVSGVGSGVGGIGSGHGPGSILAFGFGGRRSPHESKPFLRSPLKDSLTYNEGEKAVEFEADGMLHQLGIYEPLQLMAKADWEASVLPVLMQEASERMKKLSEKEPTPKTPAPARKGKKGGATPKTPKPPPDQENAQNESESGTGSSAAASAHAGGTGSGLLSLGDPENLEKKPLKLPEAHYAEIDDYELEDAPPLPSSYFRFVEKPPEEQDEEVEYDMDEEDVAWLNIINERRGQDNLNRISEDQFELLMDRLEKESYFHVQTNGSKDFAAPIDEDAICCVCMDGECSNTNVILFCDLCNLAVHQECYGVPYIPEGQWLCRRCLQSPSRSVECCLCPNKGGAFKQTDDGRWAHVVCGLWIPEVRFANTVFLEPIDSIDNIPPARWKLSCRVCKQRGMGACIQCHKTNCYTAFHVTCGLLAGLHMKMDTVREPSASGLSVTVRKTAYCDVHTPADSDCKPKLDDVAALGIITPKQKANSNGGGSNGKVSKKAAGGSPVPVLFRGLMNFSPQCPWDKVQEIASLINVQKKNQFFQRLMAYWTLKRQTRNGVPLIRRLQFAKATRADRAPETPQKNARHSNKNKARGQAGSMGGSQQKELREMAEQRRLLRRLRQDLERVRLLCELIRKREQRKRELLVNKAKLTELQCYPILFFLRKIIDMLVEIDQQEIFAEPVSLSDVPDYLDHIKQPMDLRTMRDKVEKCCYLSVEEFEVDFNIMVQNCLSYNEKDTVYFKAGIRMKDVGGSILRKAKNEIEEGGLESGRAGRVAMAEVSEEGVATSTTKVSDSDLLKEIDSFMSDEELKASMTHEEYLNRLLDLQDKASRLHNPATKQKRTKLLKSEVSKAKRKLSFDKAGTTGKQKTNNNKSHDSENDENNEDSGKDFLNTDEDDEEAETSAGGRRALRTAGRKGVNTSTPSSSTVKSSGGRGGGGRRGSRKLMSTSTSSVKRGLEGSEDTPSKKSNSTAESASATSANNTNGSPLKSGVNRRNAVLFTRKKQAGGSTPTSSPVTTAVSTPRKGDKNEVLMSSEDVGLLENMETEVQSPRPALMEANPDDDDVVHKTPCKTSQKSPTKSPAKSPNKSPNKSPPKSPAKSPAVSACAPKSPVKGQTKTAAVKAPPPKAAGKKGALTSAVTSTSSVGSGEAACVREAAGLSAASDAAKTASTPQEAASKKDSASFQVYRRAGEIGETDEDDDTQSESATDAIGGATTTSGDEEDSDSEDEDDDEEDDDDSDASSTVDGIIGSGFGGGSRSGGLSSQALNVMQLEPLDLVWAKCRGYPWYPALIINPKMPRTGYLHNGVPIPVPPQDVLDMACTHTAPHFLILFFDSKRTWQWLPREKLEPLGVDSEVDKAKLMQSKKPSERKAVKKAYEDAILHRCCVTGENATVSTEESSEAEDSRS